MRYELDDLEEMLTETSPVVLRNARPPPVAADINPFLTAAAEFGFKPPMDVEKRLAAMTYMGGGDSAIHGTQVSVTASLLNSGLAFDEVVALVLHATMAAAGDYGHRWNWQREESAIHKMCLSWIKKHPEVRKTKKAEAGQTEQQQAVNDPQVIDLSTKRREREEHAKPKTDKKNKNPFHIIIGEAFFAYLKLNDKDLRVFTDPDGQESLWLYEAGLWSLTVDARPWLEGQIELIVRALQMPHYSDMKTCAEARGYILRSPNVRRLQHSTWDQHGKIPVKGYLIDPVNLSTEQLTKEHYATWTLEIDYDPAARCPWWQIFLNDLLSDREPAIRTQTIELLQEILGVALIDNKPKALMKALIAEGQSNSGKTSLINVFSGMFTEQPITTSLESLGGTHGMMQFVRRAPWVLHEAFSTGKWIPSDRVKAIISGDPIDINIKNGPLITKRVTQPIFWATNAPVQIKEPTSAMKNRVVIIECRQEFKEAKPVGAGAEAIKRGYENPAEFFLRQEKSGILNWALAGMQRAMKRGHFSLTDEIEELLEETRAESNMVAGFIRECVGFNYNYRIRVQDFCAAFAVWWESEKSTDRHPPSNDTIGRQLAAYGDPRVGVDNKWLRDANYRFYGGMHLNRAGLDYWSEATSPDRTSTKTARTSTSKDEVNGFIPVGWEKYAVVKRMKIANEVQPQEDKEEPK
jgi:hypothetical protein